MPRSLALVDHGLRNVFRELVAGREPWPLYLYGPAGTGKTRAALCLCDAVTKATYVTVEDLCNQVMGRSWGGLNFGDDDPALSWEEKLDLAVLDEIGCRQNVGDLHYNVVREFADDREFHHGSVAVYVSNLSPEQLAQVYDARIASRLLCGTWHHLDGQDRRLNG